TATPRQSCNTTVYIAYSAYLCFFYSYPTNRHPHSFPTRRSSDLRGPRARPGRARGGAAASPRALLRRVDEAEERPQHEAERRHRSEEHTSELQSPCNLVCRLLLEKKKKNI